MRGATARIVALLLAVLPLGLCAPERVDAAEAGRPSSGIVNGSDVELSSGCGLAADEGPGLPQAKTQLVTVASGVVAFADLSAIASAHPLPVPVTESSPIFLDVLAFRAPPRN